MYHETMRSTLRHISTTRSRAGQIPSTKGTRCHSSSATGTAAAPPKKPGRPAPERPSLPGHVALGALGHDPTEELAQGGGVAVAADLPQTVFKASKRGYLPADTSVQWTHFSSEHL